MVSKSCLSRRSILGLLAYTACGLPAIAQTTSGAGTADSQPTRSTGQGPEYRQGAPQLTRFWREGDPGTRLHLQVRVMNTQGQPLPGAEVELWQADGAGEYHDQRYRSAITAGRRGVFALDTALPGQYYGSKHIHLILRHQGYQTLTTRILFKGDPNLPAHESDLAILLEEVNKDGKTVLVGNVELVMEPSGS